METPYLPQSIFGKDFEDVYEPAEDTYLLLDALEKDLDQLRERTCVCMEIGSGSGAVITAVSKSLQRFESTSRIFIATDINHKACKTTKKCATYHGQHSIQVIRGNLAEPMIDRLENQVDLLIFNPPYVPTIPEELAGENTLSLAWAGGTNGTWLIEVFLRSSVPRLLSKPNGVAYMVALDRNNLDHLLNFLSYDFGIKGTVSMQRRAGTELLYVIKYQWSS